MSKTLQHLHQKFWLKGNFLWIRKFKTKYVFAFIKFVRAYKHHLSVINTQFISVISAIALRNLSYI